MKHIKAAQETPGELDLMELLAKSISFLRKYVRLIAAFFLAGILVGALVYWVLPKIYSSTLLLQPALLTNTEQVTTINSWNKMLNDKQYDELARLFNIKSSVISRVKSISAEDGGGETGPSGNFTAFSVRIRVTDPSVITNIQKGILYALENGDYVKEKLAAQKSSYKALIDITSNEINRLDSMRSAIEKSIVAPRQSAGSVIMDVSEINNTTIALHTKLLQLKDSLNFSEATHILQNFYTPTRQDEPKLSKILGLGAAAGLVLGFMVSFYLSMMQNFKYRKQVSAHSTHNIQPVTPSRLKHAQPH